jgi:hypothetical protein
MLATLHELLIQDESDIHLASFAPLQSRLTAFLEAHAAAVQCPLPLPGVTLSHHRRSFHEADV